MVALMLGGTISALPTSTHNLSPAGPTHASLHDGSAGEGPSSDHRTAYATSAFLDIRPRESRFGGPSGEAVTITFDIRELNNVGATVDSFTWRLTTLDGENVIDGVGTVPVSMEVEGLGSTEWNTSIAISSRLYRDMMLQGRDQLRLALTFRGTDANSNALTISQTIPAHLTQRVAMLVDQDVYPLIRDKLARYEDDANLRGSVEFIHRTGNWGSPEAVRALLKQLWRDEAITGAMLWGYLPFAMWDMVHSDDSHEIFPIPVFYEDMDGSFADTNGDGIYDKHYWGENDGCEIWTSFIMPPRELVPEENLDPSGQGTGGGLSASYYNSRNKGNWRMNRVDPTLDFYWLEDLPQEIDDDDFSVKWTGRIRADASETYTLSPLHGGGLCIWIDGNLVHDYWTGTTWKKWERMSTVYMTKGWHDIRIEYNNNNWGFDGAVRLLWTSDQVLAGTLNDWLDRSHAYHQGALEYNEEALLFMDYGYGIKCNMRDPILNKHIKPLYGDEVVVKGCTNTTSGDDYIKALEPGYELISVWSHAGSASHWIAYQDIPDEVNGSAPSYKIRNTQAGLVTLIWGCHAGDFGGGHEGEGVSFLSDNLAANYAFSTPYGLACAAATRSIGTTFKEAYWAWDNGSSLATGFAANLEAEYDRATIERTAPNIAQDMWVKDVVLMGDPFIRVDHRPWNNTLTIDGGAEYTMESNVTLTLSAFDAKEMRFKNAGGDWTPWEAYCDTRVWNIGDEYGAHRVYSQVRNSWGRAEYNAFDVITKVAIMSDRVSIELESGAELTNSTLLEVTLDIGEAEPSMVWMSLRDDRGDWSSWSPFIARTNWQLGNGDGERTVVARFVGDDGIWRAEASDSIVLDTRPPVTTVTLDGRADCMDWYVSEVSIHLNASDALSGPDLTEWSLDGGDFYAYNGPVQVQGDGEHLLRYRSRDLAGNLEAVSTETFKIDETAPADLSIEVSSGTPVIGLASLDITLGARDATSGLDAMRFQTDGGGWGPWMAYATSVFMTITEDEGEHTIDYQVRDLAGNVATVEEPLVVLLDRTGPGVLEATPGAEDVDVPVDAQVRIVFDEEMEGSTITGTNLLVQDPVGIPVVGTIEVLDGDSEVVFTPGSPLDPYTTYSIMLRGAMTDLAGNGLNGGAGQIWSFTTVGVPPDPPEELTAEASTTTIVLSWKAPGDTGSGEFQGYNLYRMRDDGAGESFQLLELLTSTTFEDTDVDQGVQYHYVVRSLTSYGEGADSNVASAIVIPGSQDPGEDPVEDPGEDPEDPKPNESGGLDDEEPSRSSVGTYALIIVAVVAVAFIGAYLYMRQDRGPSA